MPASKIQDEQEVIKWIEEGKTYREICNLYLEKYNIVITPSALGNFVRRRGLPKRLTRMDDVLPWVVHDRHARLYPAQMLRELHRKLHGQTVNDPRRLESWLAWLAEQDAVVHYDPDTPEAWWYVKREPGDAGEVPIRRPSKQKKARSARTT